jgi:nucleoid DNA-binding protein
MAKLTKRDIVVAISNQTGMVQHQVFDVVQRTLDKITDSLANNIPVELRNFGVFQPRLTKPRVGRNPNQPGSSFVIPPRATVKFKAGKIMRQRVEKLSRELKEAAERKTLSASKPREALREQILNCLFQSLKIDRFGEMFGKPCGPCLVDVLFCSKTTKRDSGQVFAETHFTH